MANNILVAAIDFGTTYSGWACLFGHEFNLEPTKGFIKHWYSESSLVTEKTPTVVLIKPEGNELEAFGYEAENRYYDMDEEDRKGYYYFRRFKMKLHKQLGDNVDFGMMLEDEMGRTLPAIDVFSMTIKYFIDDVYTGIKDRILGVIEKSEIHYVLTVPAIWTDSAKQFMRRAGEKAGIAVNKLSIALEPEAASIFCRYLPAEKWVDKADACIATFSEGTQYMVLDAGGGTIDITVHEVQDDGAIKELQAASGGGWGGVLVDEAFEKLIIDVVGDIVYKIFKQEHTEGWLDLWRDFELKKRTIQPSKITKVVMNIPVGLCSVYESQTKNSFAEAVESSSYAEKIEFVPKNMKLKFDAVLFMKLFDVSLTKTIQHTENVLRDPVVENIKAILMVGGFSESPMLQQKVKITFPDINVIVPKEASSSILRGALIYGHRPSAISERVLRYTYGVSIVTTFIKGVHPEDKYQMTEQGPKCRNVFDKHVERNEIVKVGEQQATQTYKPAFTDQTCISFPVYASELKDPKYTDVGCKYIGEMSIDLPDHDGDLSRKVEVNLTFSGTEIEVSAFDVKSGTSKNASINFLG